jgi:phosphoribosylanthranilate isomerase
MTRVKVCGLTRAEDVAAVVEAGADAVGAVVDVPVDSPREVTAERARALFADVPPFVTTVLVTMPRSVERATELVEATEPDVLQIHGGLDPDAVALLSEWVPSDVVVAVDADDETAAHEYAPVADAILVDSTDEAGAGGTGRTHDWDATRRLRASLDVPVVLAGGLTPETVATAIETVDPFAVDVASGVEERGGEKDQTAVADFVAAARSAVQ